MITDSTLDDVALSVIRAFLTAQGFKPLDGWSKSDKYCYIRTSYHQIWTLGGKYTGDGAPDIDKLSDALAAYLLDLQKLPSSLANFNPYDCELIDTYSTCETYLFVSIYL